MRPRTLMMPLAIGLAGYAFLDHRRRQRARRDRDAADAARADRFARNNRFDSDPRDPVQSFDEVAELQGVPLDIDAQSRADAEAAQDLADLEAELAPELGMSIRDAETDEDGDAEEVIELTDRKAAGDGADTRNLRRDAGDLYGAHTPPATDREHPDDDRAFQEGQNWVEALEASAVEYGPEVERELDVVDDEDVLEPPHASDTRDRPVADHGAGGVRGL